MRILLVILSIVTVLVAHEFFHPSPPSLKHRSSKPTHRGSYYPWVVEPRKGNTVTLAQPPRPDYRFRKQNNIDSALVYVQARHQPSKKRAD